jgi:hypothetical protein
MNELGRGGTGGEFPVLGPVPIGQRASMFKQMTRVALAVPSALALAGCETKSTTSIHAGFLHMSDVIAMQPNLNIPLSLVAPDERRGKMLVEVNRPTFSRLSPRLAEVCRFIAFSSLRERLSQGAPFVHDLRPDVLDDLSESYAIEDA